MSDKFNISDLPTKVPENGVVFLSGKSVNSILSVIRQLWRGDNITVRGSIKKTAAGDGGLSIRGATTIVSSSNQFTENPYPFQVTIQENPDAPNTYQASVNYYSSFLNSLKPNDHATITGLNTLDSKGNQVPTWITINATDTLWIEGAILNFSVQSLSLKSGGNGDTFDPTLNAWNTNAYVEDDSGTGESGQVRQTYFRFPIADFTPDSSGVPQINQMVDSHQILKLISIDGRAAIYPQPSPYGPYGV